MEYPTDVVIVSYHNNLDLLLRTVTELTLTGHTFIVSPSHAAVAMSREASRKLGLDD